MPLQSSGSCEGGGAAHVITQAPKMPITLTLNGDCLITNLELCRHGTGARVVVPFGSGGEGSLAGGTDEGHFG